MKNEDIIFHGQIQIHCGGTQMSLKQYTMGIGSGEIKYNTSIHKT